MSDPVQVTSGVPQGSVLGPILFLIYVNHVVSNLKCKLMIFADDIKLYLTHQSDLPFPEEYLQRDIDTLLETGASWGLLLNVDKCKCMRFSPSTRDLHPSGPSPYNISSEPIDFVAKHKDLGIIIDSSLKFHRYRD